MKKSISLFLLALAASAACGKIESVINTPAETGLVPLTFTAATDASLTKTSLNANFQIIWSTADEITVFDGDGAQPFSVSSVDRGGLEATFSGSAQQASAYYAVSPAQSGASLSDGKITAELPSDQTATADSFDPAAALSVAQASDYQFQFKNVGALVGVTLGNEGITGIRLESLGGEALSGTVTVLPDGTLQSKTGAAYVELTGTLAKDATYYFVVLPGTYQNGLSVTLQKGSEYARFNMTASQTIERNGNLSLGTLTGSKWKTAFTVGADVTIQGAGSEEGGQQVAYVGGTDYWNGSVQYSDVAGYAYNYEIFTRLKGGYPFYFEAAGGEKFSLNAAGDAVEHLSNIASAAYSAPEDGIYRIRMSLPAGAAEIKRISEVKYDLYGLDSRAIPYIGAGVWQSTNFHIRTDSYKNRYRFVVSFADGSNQYYGRHRSAGGNPTYGTTEAAYFYVQPTIDSSADHWSPCFQYPAAYENVQNRFYCTMTLYLNNDKGHYTHAVTNVVDLQDPGITAGEAITIQGAGALEAGQQMRYSTAFFNSSVANSGDLAAVASPEGFDYEIFTKLGQGKIHFRTAGGRIFSLNAAGNGIVAILTEDDAAYECGEANRVYRIRINSATKAASVQRIWAANYLQPDRGLNESLSYIGGGVWKGDIPFGWTHPKSWGNSERFKFKFQIYFDQAGVWQYYGRYETASTYTSNHIQPITDDNTLGSWNNFLTVEGDPVLSDAAYQVEYGYCTIYFKMNADDPDGYTYEITDIRP